MSLLRYSTVLTDQTEMYFPSQYVNRAIGVYSASQLNLEGGCRVSVGGVSCPRDVWAGEVLSFWHHSLWWPTWALTVGEPFYAEAEALEGQRRSLSNVIRVSWDHGALDIMCGFVWIGAESEDETHQPRVSIFFFFLLVSSLVSKFSVFQKSKSTYCKETLSTGFWELSRCKSSTKAT